MKTLTVLMVLGLASLINGHGYLRNPPARNCMWRYGFNTPPNYDDDANFCGGAFEMAKLGGRCGVCGDKVTLKNQPHADGGKYDNGIIVEDYKQGQIINIEVLLTTSHWGYFEFRIGDFTNKKTEGDSFGKLKGQLMKLIAGGTRFQVTKKGRYLYKTYLKLPDNLVCKRCVIQWWYRGGNNWGCDKTGCGMGHGTQENFVNCADVKIQ